MPAPQQRRQPRKLPVVADRDDDRLVGRRERLIGHDIGMADPLPPRIMSADQSIRRLVGEHRQLRVEQGHVDRRAVAGLLTPHQRGHDCIGGIQTGEQIGDRDPGAHRSAPRLTIRQTRQAHQPAHSLDNIIIAGARRRRPILPETGYRRIDQSRIGAPQRLRVEPELFQSSDPEILDQHIGVARHPRDQRRALGIGKVDRHRPFAAIGAKIISRNPHIAMLMPRRPPVPRVVARSRLLDLDYLGAKVRQRLRRPRPGEYARQVEDSNALEGSHACFLHDPHPFRSLKIAAAALWPGAPVTPPPGCAPDPHR